MGSDVATRDPAARVDSHSSEDARLPHVVSTFLSYLTISRSGDVALRSSANHERDREAWRESDPGSDQSLHVEARWRRDAMLVLLGLALGLPAVVAGILAVQSSPRATRRR